jgi:DNA-binding NtrC family response regulator
MTFAGGILMLSATLPSSAPTSHTALIISGDQQLEYSLRQQLNESSFRVVSAINADSAMVALRIKNFDLVLVAEMLTEGQGVDFIRGTAKRFGDTRFVLIANVDQLRTAVDAVQAGAHDLLPLPLESDGVPSLLARLAKARRRERDLERPPIDAFENILTISPAITRAIAEARQVAPFDAPVLLIGEPGVGKELFARAIHAASSRARSGVASLDCATLSESSLESELTAFEPDTSGTLILNDIDKLPVKLQASLQRFLEDRDCGRPEEKGLRADLRFIATTDCDLYGAVKRGAFRADLYYRLAVFPITIAPLRERREDIALLARHFVQLLAARLDTITPRLEASALELLLGFGWPGNVRQLGNVLERAMILHRNHDLTAAHLAPLLQAPPHLAPLLQAPPHLGPSDTTATTTFFGWELPLEGINIDVLQRDLMLQAMARTGGNVARAATLVGLSRTAFSSRINRLMGHLAKKEIPQSASKPSLYDMIQRQIN